ncbi:MAG: glycosyltransferase [Acidimicrobiales bacterium]
MGRSSLLPRLVETVLSDPAASELIAVVDGVDPVSLSVLKDLEHSYPRLTSFAAPSGGHLRTLSAGIARARSEVVLLLDDDVLPGPGLAGSHLRHHAGGTGLVVMGWMPVLVTPGTRPSVGTLLYRQEYASHCLAIERGERDVLDALWGGNVSLSRADCLRVGIHSDRFDVHYHSDRDLGLRLAEAGLRGIFDRRLGASHLHARSNRDFLRDATRQGVGLSRLHQIHLERLGPLHPSVLVADLPFPLRIVVRVVGSSRWAKPLASVILAAGTVVGHFGWRWPETQCAKFSRRCLQWQGVRQGGYPETAAEPVVSTSTDDALVFPPSPGR